MLDKQDLQIFKVASKDATRPVLTGVLFSKVKHNGGWAIRLAATDGIRLTEKTIDVDFEPAFSDMIIPASTVEAVSKLLDRHRRVMISESQFKIMRVNEDPEGILERTITIGMTIDGVFPGYEHIVPKGEAKVATTVNAKLLIDALKQCDTGLVLLELHDVNAPVVLKDGEDNTSVISYVMPIKG